MSNFFSYIMAGAYLRKIAPLPSTTIRFCNLLFINNFSRYSYLYVYYMVFSKLLQENYLKKSFIGRSIMGPLGTKTSQWSLGHVLYLPYPRYATVSWQVQVIFDEMMMKPTLYLTNTLSWIFIVLAYWNNSPRVDMSPHSDTLSWFRANQWRSHKYQFHSLWVDTAGARPHDQPHSKRAH